MRGHVGQRGLAECPSTRSMAVGAGTEDMFPETKKQDGLNYLSKEGSSDVGGYFRQREILGKGTELRDQVRCPEESCVSLGDESGGGMGA